MLLKQSVYEFFCVCVFHKKLCSSQCFCFLLFLFLDSVSGRVGKIFWVSSRQLLLWTRVTSPRCTSWTIWQMTVPTFWNFVCEHDMPCALEKIIMAEVGETIECCSSTNKNIYPLPQYLWPPNKAEWWLTVRGTHP